MGSTNAFKCDGPGCDELTTKAPNTRTPSQWRRLVYRGPGSELTVTVAFHDVACAAAWLETQPDGDEIAAASQDV